MSLTRLPLPEADRLVARSTVGSCAAAIAALALAAAAFAALNNGVQAAAMPAAISPAVSPSGPVDTVPSAAEALSKQPWREEPEVVTSGG